jgi:tetratricopeptide (TPR) repeat protein
MTDQQLSSVNEQFEGYMNAGHSAAWDHQNWEKAVELYSRAAKLRPDMPIAFISLGLALLQVNPPRLQEALRFFQRAHDLDHDDPLPLEMSADVLERMGRLQEAAKQYVAVADAYLAQHDIEKAIHNWERATRVTPGLVRVHQQLALAYERLGYKREAVNEYLTLAALFQQNNKRDIAKQMAQKALQLEPRNPDVLNTIHAIDVGSEVLYRDKRLEKDDREVKKQHETLDDSLMLDVVAPEADTRGLITETVEIALSNLAMAMTEGDLMADFSIMEAIQAIEYHRIGAVDEAIGAYQRAEAAGMRDPAMAFNLGALFLERQHWKDAVPYLERALRDASLEAGANHGLGLAYSNLGNTRQAVQHLVHAIQMVNTDSSSPEKLKQQGPIYERLLHNIQHTDEVTIQTINSRFLSLLSGPDWKQRIELTRHDIERAIIENPDLVPDIVIVSPEMVAAMKRIDEYMQHRRYILAMEECYHILEYEPDYLPAHLRIGQILMRMGQLERAVDKYRYIADTYLARDDKVRAREILAEVVDIAPMNTELREHLIELLEEEQRWDEILDQYLNLATAYEELADASNARTTLQQAIQLAQRAGIDKTRIVQVYHKLADVELMRLDNRSALRAYENIKNLQPEDEKAREMLIDLNYRLGDPASAVRELDTLLQLYAKQRKGNAILKLLETWVNKRNSDEALRTRLAAVYQQIQKPGEALKQYDAVLEIQLKQGRHNDACQTLRKILALKPQNPQKYLSLAKQLGCA